MMFFIRKEENQDSKHSPLIGVLRLCIRIGIYELRVRYKPNIPKKLWVQGLQ